MPCATTNFQSTSNFYTIQNKPINALLPKGFDSTETTEAFLNLNKVATFTIDAIEKTSIKKPNRSLHYLNTSARGSEKSLFFCK